MNRDKHLRWEDDNRLSGLGAFVFWVISSGLVLAPFVILYFQTRQD